MLALMRDCIILHELAHRGKPSQNFCGDESALGNSKSVNEVKEPARFFRLTAAITETIR
jgi:hypothetical protein